MFFEIFQNEFTSFGKYDYGCHLVVVCLRSIDSYKLLSEVKEITEELKSMTERVNKKSCNANL